MAVALWLISAVVWVWFFVGCFAVSWIWWNWFAISFIYYTQAGISVGVSNFTHGPPYMNSGHRLASNHNKQCTAGAPVCSPEAHNVNLLTVSPIVYYECTSQRELRLAAAAAIRSKQ